MHYIHRTSVNAGFCNTLCLHLFYHSKTNVITCGIEQLIKNLKEGHTDNHGQNDDLIKLFVFLKKPK
jgi:hypothetical protein